MYVPPFLLEHLHTHLKSTYTLSHERHALNQKSAKVLCSVESIYDMNSSVKERGKVEGMPHQEMSTTGVPTGA